MITQNEISSVLKPVTEILAQLNVPYYIGGSVASSTYGLARSTLDVDMISNLREEHVAAFVSALQDNYYVSAEMIHGAIERNSSFNLIHFATGLKIDVFIGQNRPYDVAASLRIRSDTLSDAQGETLFYLAAPEDIILAKLLWFEKGGRVSKKQWEDILGVLRVQGSKLDFEYMDKWAQELKVKDLLGKAISEGKSGQPVME